MTDISNRVPSRRTHKRGSVVSLRRGDWVQKLDDWSPHQRHSIYQPANIVQLPGNSKNSLGSYCRVRELEKARFRKRMRLALYRNRSPLMR